MVILKKIIQTTKGILKKMAGPDKIPKGSWGGDLDPMNKHRRLDFEAGLEQQQRNIQQMHASAASLQKSGIQVIDSMPPANAPGGPDAGNYRIPEATRGGDLIGEMGADQARIQAEFQKAAAATGEGPPIPEIPPDPVLPPGGQRRVDGHVPPSLQRQLAEEKRQQAIAAAQQQAANAERYGGGLMVGDKGNDSGVRTGLNAGHLNQEGLNEDPFRKRSPGFIAQKAMLDIDQISRNVVDGTIPRYAIGPILKELARLQFDIASRLEVAVSGGHNTEGGIT